MRAYRTPVLALTLAALAVLSGCAGFLAGESSAGPERTVTPAPIPDDDQRATTPADPATATPVSQGPNGRAIAAAAPTRTHWVGIENGTNRSTARQPRYFSLRPNCERPPTQVVQIQVGALMNSGPNSTAGIRTTWEFASPANQALVGSYTAFVDLISTQYRPLLEAETVAYGPLSRDGDVASQRVSVQSKAGSVTSYTWRLKNQSQGVYEGCWMTFGVGEIRRNSS